MTRCIRCGTQIHWGYSTVCMQCERRILGSSDVQAAINRFLAAEKARGESSPSDRDVLVFRLGEDIVLPTAGQWRIHVSPDALVATKISDGEEHG